VKGLMIMFSFFFQPNLSL